MNTEIDQIADSAGETATTVAEVAFGAAQTVREVASDPIGSARKQVKGLERKGTPAARKINRRFNARLSKAAKVAGEWMPERIVVMGMEVNGKLPEKVVIMGLELVKVQARRRDVVGGVAKRTLRFANGSFKTIAKTASRLEYASETRHAPVNKTVVTKAAAKTSAKVRRTKRAAARRRAA